MKCLSENKFLLLISDETPVFHACSDHFLQTDGVQLGEGEGEGVEVLEVL